MKRLALALSLAALLLPAFARAGISFGVTEDAGKYSSDGGATVLAHLRDLGMTENAISVQWDPDRPTTILEKPLLDRLVPNAARNAIRVVFTVYFTRPNAVSTTPGGADRYAAFLRLLAHTYPQVRDYIIGNEPNYGVFWQPQFDRTGRPLAGAGYEDLLARSYDALKSVDPRLAVVGMGLAPRGNDRPFSRSPSTSPVLFVRDVGEAYRRSGRTRPLMDSFAYHPYPPSSLATPATTTGWPDAAVADLGRIKQAVWDAFNGTTQPTFETGLTMRVTEIGWQVGASGPAYHGTENVRTIDETTQARNYVQVVRQLSCDPSVSDVLFFHLVDEADLRGFQSGMVRADGSVRPSYSAVRSAIAAGGCASAAASWQHAADVVGATVTFGDTTPSGLPSLSAGAQEGALYKAAVVRVDAAPTAAQRDALQRTLALASSGALTGSLRTYIRTQPALAAPADAGTYVETVLVSALANPARTSFFVSEPFTYGQPAADTSTPAKTAAPACAPASPRAAKTTPPPPATQAPVTPAPTSFAVAPSPQATAKSPPPVTAFHSGAKTRAKPNVHVPSSASFAKLPRPSRARPGSSSLSEPDGTRREKTAVTPSLSLDPRKGGHGLPILFGLLLAGAAVSAVVSVRLLGR